MTEETEVNKTAEVEIVAEAPVVPPQPNESAEPIQPIEPINQVPEIKPEEPTPVSDPIQEQVEVKTEEKVEEKIEENTKTETVVEEKQEQKTEEKIPQEIQQTKTEEELFSPRKYLMSLLVKANLAVQNKKRKNLDKLIEYFNTKEKVKNNDVEKLLGVKDAAATNYLNRLVKDNKIERHGTGSGTWYSKTLK
ncbi:MAG: hypothetical protein QG566_598 [Patescibacteria group bacterium]|nr:hypothetical protein [Patescibacteria group bacterium]